MDPTREDITHTKMQAEDTAEQNTATESEYPEHTEPTPEVPLTNVKSGNGQNGDERVPRPRFKLVYRGGSDEWETRRTMRRHPVACDGQCRKVLLNLLEKKKRVVAPARLPKCVCKALAKQKLRRD